MMSRTRDLAWAIGRRGSRSPARRADSHARVGDEARAGPDRAARTCGSGARRAARAASARRRARELEPRARRRALLPVRTRGSKRLALDAAAEAGDDEPCLRRLASIAGKEQARVVGMLDAHRDRDRRAGSRRGSARRASVVTRTASAPWGVMLTRAPPTDDTARVDSPRRRGARARVASTSSMETSRCSRRHLERDLGLDAQVATCAVPTSAACAAGGARRRSAHPRRRARCARRWSWICPSAMPSVALVGDPAAQRRAARRSSSRTLCAARPRVTRLTTGTLSPRRRSPDGATGHDHAAGGELGDAGSAPCVSLRGRLRARTRAARRAGAGERERDRAERRTPSSPPASSRDQASPAPRAMRFAAVRGAAKHLSIVLHRWRPRSRRSRTGAPCSSTTRPSRIAPRRMRDVDRRAARLRRVAARRGDSLLAAPRRDSACGLVCLTGGDEAATGERSPARAGSGPIALLRSRTERAGQRMSGFVAHEAGEATVGTSCTCELGSIASSGGTGVADSRIERDVDRDWKAPSDRGRAGRPRARRRRGRRR